ncbi:MAG: dihydrofolate reductase family protein [Acidimicrobiales bacterium]
MNAAEPPIVDLLSCDRSAIDPMEDVARERRHHDDGRPWVFTNMIQSADGATSIDGLSAPLGSPADLAILLALRAVADVIVVGSSTASGEGYQPPNPSSATRQARRSRSQSDRPLIAVVTSSLSISPSAPLFSDPSYRPLIITTDNAPADRAAALGSVADLVVAGDTQVSLPQAIELLADRGHRHVLLEGGPILNGQFVVDDLIDEWNITFAPLLVAGSAARRPWTDAKPRTLTLARLWESGGLLFGRYLRG